MKKERLFFLWMLLGILFLSACSDDDNPEPFQISLDPAKMTLTVGDRAEISLNGAPQNAAVVWSSSDEQVARVDQGEVEALAKGLAIIRVKASLDGVTSEAQCELTVEADPMTEVIEFGDALLKSKLLEIPGLDADGDGNIMVKEALAVHKLEFSYQIDQEITEENTFASVEGLQHFANLDTLTLNYHRISDVTPLLHLKKLTQLHLGANQISEIDLGELTALKDLRVFKNTGITRLDLSRNTALEILDVYSTGLGELDLSPLKSLNIVVARQTNISTLKVADLPLLTGLDLREGVLTEFEARNLPALEKLYIERNRIARLSLSELPVLQHLVAYENQITTIDFDLPKLMFFTAFDNRITVADFSRMPSLFRCYMSNNPVVKVDFSKNPLIAQIELQDMPDMEEIDLKNGNFMDSYDYMFLYNNPKLHTIRVDSGDEETYVKSQTKNFPQIKVVTE